MAASSTDKLLKTGAATKTTLASPGKAVGAASININSAVNWPTDTAVIFAIRNIALVDGEYQEVSGTYAEFKGVVSGTTINSLTLVYGTDQVYIAGSTTEVFIPISSFAHNQMIDALLVQHTQLGAHKSLTTDTFTATGAITLPAGALETQDYADNSVTVGKIGYSTVPAFRAFLNASQTSANNAVVKLDAEDFDNLSAFNPATNQWRFVAPITAVYHFSWNIHSSAGTDILSGISKNGTVVARGAWIKGATFVASSGSTDLSLTAGDYVQLFCVSLGGTATIDAGTANTYLSGHLVAKL
jgi:hypothetical protein